MLCIKHHSTDPYFNIATDEYIFKHIKEDCFMLWRNDNAIIVGKHQNTQAEINHDYVKERGIKVVRRLSGGGAVYHDLGNLNFSFTRTGENYEMIDFERYTRPIIAVLKELGVNAKFEGRNDLTIEGKKFSGNAEHVFKNKVLHHGTLLFSSEMTDVSGALKINPLKYKDRGVKSVPNRVTNISDHLPEKISLDEFTNKIMDYIIHNFEDARLYEFTDEDLAAIQKIRDEKYSTWEWNFGYSPDYNFKQGARTPGGTVEMNMNVTNGIIQKVKITGDFFHIRDIGPIEEALENTRHEEKMIRQKLSQFDLGEYFNKISEDDLVAIMF
ncbi:lipoate--protein ligase [Salinimicrobium sp. MT39]|uniref:lipoate--protein ligase n=1 Tax=Salinimicrobium profundisediminis TaxID=2994553 RepID=A0A9X3I1P2_9FLAO|nr:lipoate--protein ligase [Salinimicrobium profundisediminis]MCX2838804.1 lipoate--protein ligase [Salinimicrobium profundisediminis]